MRREILATVFTRRVKRTPLGDIDADPLAITRSTAEPIEMFKYHLPVLNAVPFHCP
jgi:hypothetical protein